LIIIIVGGGGSEAIRALSDKQALLDLYTDAKANQKNLVHVFNSLCNQNKNKGSFFAI
jgi:hypothetical protein